MPLSLRLPPTEATRLEDGHTSGTLLLDGNADLGQMRNNMSHSAITTTQCYAKSREAKRHKATKTMFQNLRAPSHTEASSV